MQLSLIIACRAAEGQYTEYEEKPDTWNVTDQALALSCEIAARKENRYIVVFMDHLSGGIPYS